MKHLIIIGAPRSGKSSLAKMLHQKYGYNILSLDDLVQGFVQNFPEIGITEENETKNSPLITPFVKTYALIQTQWTYPDMPIVIEGTHISPRDALDLASVDSEQFKIIVLGFPNISAKEKMALIRKHDKPTDWSFDQSDDELYKGLEQAINYSKWLKEQCQELGIDFLDTSFDREKVIEEFVSKNF